MNLNSRQKLVARLRRGRRARQQFVESHLSKGIAYQIRATRDRLGWSQERLAQEVGMNQNAISRLESSNYGKPTITTLKRMAAALDVGLIVRFVPFSEMIDWMSGTPHVSKGLSTEALAVPDFATEEARGTFEANARVAAESLAHWAQGFSNGLGEPFTLVGRGTREKWVSLAALGASHSSPAAMFAKVDPKPLRADLSLPATPRHAMRIDVNPKQEEAGAGADLPAFVLSQMNAPNPGWLQRIS